MAGFGGAVVLLPALVWAVGPREAVPILTVAQLCGNLARVGFNRRELDWPVAGTFPLAGFLPLGAVFGFLSAVLGSVGPVVAPFFLAYGLVKGAYIGTEAFGAAAMHLTKTLAYGRLTLLSAGSLVAGGALGLLMIAGSYVAGVQLLVLG